MSYRLVDEQGHSVTSESFPQLVKTAPGAVRKYIEAYDMDVLLSYLPDEAWFMAKHAVPTRILANFAIDRGRYGDLRATVQAGTVDVTTPAGRNAVRENFEIATAEHQQLVAGTLYEEEHRTTPLAGGHIPPGEWEIGAVGGRIRINAQPIAGNLNPQVGQVDRVTWNREILRREPREAEGNQPPPPVEPDEVVVAAYQAALYRYEERVVGGEVELRVTENPWPQERVRLVEMADDPNATDEELTDEGLDAV